MDYLCCSIRCVDMQETNVTVENNMYFLTDRYRDSASETIHSQAVQKDKIIDLPSTTKHAGQPLNRVPNTVYSFYFYELSILRA